MIRLPRLLMVLLLVPVVVHVAGMAATTVAYLPAPLGLNVCDVIVTSMLAAYLALYVYVRTRPLLAARVAVAVYSFLLALIVAECVFALLEPRGVNLPLVPTHHVTYPGDHLVGCRSPAHWSVNRYGVRGPDAAPSSCDNAILCVGNSTTECFFIDDQDTWPWRLQSKLEAITGQPTYVGNAGKAGHVAAQHAYLLSHYSHVRDFKVVVLLVGVNDLYRILAPAEFRPIVHEEVFPVSSVDCSPWCTSFSLSFYYRNLAILRRLRDVCFPTPPPPSGRAVIQDPTAEYVKELRLERLAALEKHPLADLPNIEEELRQYQSHIRQAIRQCRANGQAVVVMTQPTLYRENLPADLESLTWVTFTGRTDCAYTSKALAQGMSQINAATKEVCKEEGAACLDLVPVVPQDTSAFCDHCHLNNGGCEIVAGALADFIVQHDILHQPSAKTPWP